MPAPHPLSWIHFKLAQNLKLGLLEVFPACVFESVLNLSTQILFESS